MTTRKDSAFLFDLDGTLIDSVYQHVIAWREALEEVDVSLSVWKIHRRIGMSGGLFVTALRREVGDPWAIATSGSERTAGRARSLLGLPEDVPMVTRDQVQYAKPDPDLFLTAAAGIGVDIRDSIVVGDSVWDLLAARRAGALGIGLLSGGYGREELIYAGAFRVYEDPGDLLAHLDEVGVRRPA